MVRWIRMVSQVLRARERITSHFRIPSLSHLEPIFTRKILNVGFATPAVLLPQIDSIWLKSGREFLEVILSRALRMDGLCDGLSSCHSVKGDSTYDSLV